MMWQQRDTRLNRGSALAAVAQSLPSCKRLTGDGLHTPNAIFRASAGVVGRGYVRCKFEQCVSDSSPALASGSGWFLVRLDVSRPGDRLAPLGP